MLACVKGMFLAGYQPAACSFTNKQGASFK